MESLGSQFKFQKRLFLNITELKDEENNLNFCFILHFH